MFDDRIFEPGPASERIVVPTSEPHAQRLSSRVLGQDEANRAFAGFLHKLECGIPFKDGNRPQQSILLLGPSGVGKTESVYAGAEDLLQRNLALNLERNAPPVLKINCGEYGERFTITALRGSPPGYAGSEGAQGAQPPVLRPENLENHSIAFLRDNGKIGRITYILFDEIERGSKQLQDLILAITDKGDMSLGNGKVVDFSSTVVCFTSNLGLDQVRSASDLIGFEPQEVDNQDREKLHRHALERQLGSPFVGRIDQVVVFKPLGQETLDAIVRSNIRDVEDRFEKEGVPIKLRLTEEAFQFIATNSDSDSLGARPAKSKVMNLIQKPLSMVPSLIVNSTVLVSLDRDGQNLVFDKVPEQDNTEASMRGTKPSEVRVIEFRTKPEVSPVDLSRGDPFRLEKAEIILIKALQDSIGQYFRRQKQLVAQGSLSVEDCSSMPNLKEKAIRFVRDAYQERGLKGYFETNYLFEISGIFDEKEMGADRKVREISRGILRTAFIERGLGKFLDSRAALVEAGLISEREANSDPEIRKLLSARLANEYATRGPEQYVLLRNGLIDAGLLSLEESRNLGRVKNAAIKQISAALWSGGLAEFASSYERAFRSEAISPKDLSRSRILAASIKSWLNVNEDEAPEIRDAFRSAGFSI